MNKERFLKMMEAWYDNHKRISRISIDRDGDKFFVNSAAETAYPVDFLMCGDEVKVISVGEEHPVGRIRAMQLSPKGNRYYVTGEHWTIIGWFEEKDLVKL